MSRQHGALNVWRYARTTTLLALARGARCPSGGHQEVCNSGWSIRWIAGVVRVTTSVAFLLLRVHKNRRTMLPLKALDLRMAIRMLRPFAGFASGLQAVVGGLQAIRYNPITDRAAHDLRFGGHSAHTRRWCSVKNEQGR